MLADVQTLGFEAGRGGLDDRELPRLAAAGSAPWNGGFANLAERVAISQDRLYLVPEGIPPTLAGIPDHPGLLALIPGLGLISAAAFTVLAPFLMQWAVDVLPAHVYGNPTLWNLVTEPVTVLSQLLLTGTYPALPYMAYLCAGIALGRMNLTSRRVQLWLVGAGAALALLSWTVSMGALLALGVYDRIWEATPWLTEQQIDEILVFGPDPSLPTTTLWWLMVPAPHSNTPVALLLSLGMAAFALGAFLLLARLIGKALTPLAAAGSMTFTLYTLHLLFLGTGVYELHPGFWFWMQVAVFGLLAVAWQRAVGQGPLEKLVARTSKRIAGSVAAR